MYYVYDIKYAKSIIVSYRPLLSFPKPVSVIYRWIINALRKMSDIVMYMCNRFKVSLYSLQTYFVLQGSYFEARGLNETMATKSNT